MKEKEPVRKHILVSGRVQGVGFRYRTYYLAQNLGLTGWVQNLDDGRVEMELQGDEADMNQFSEGWSKTVLSILRTVW